MLRQIEGEEADRKDARGPQFVIESGYTDTSDSNVPRGVLVLRQTGGPALGSVTVSASGEGVDGMRGEPYEAPFSGYGRAESVDLGPMAAGGTATAYVDLDYHTVETTVLLHLRCRSLDGADSWERSAARQIERRPDPPPSWRTRR
ncbi:hypothetical protein RM780_25310 [Streptomyces sp. DSM 44917]|uniref:Uncharacterized protein n=1 Tax=Streptomyces boetiae TaxID=3075541 RepID=A0ABU2LF94_9ACTN|nr:hypothetical protein [Streptomyces sp. DSM 44917]MDT0310246.1 hypothetical protein [Streptomyces sp. DSM 44917]